VELLYRNVRDRDGDSRGIAFWTDELQRPGYDEADLLIDFSISEENVAGSPFIDDLRETSPGFREFIGDDTPVLLPVLGQAAWPEDERLAFV
jgi:hypothetical protein